MITLETQVGEVVKSFPLTAQVFHKNRIDYCCGGKKSIKDACREANIPGENLLEQIEGLSNTKSQTPGLNFDQLSLSFLSEYIFEVHHKYLYENLPEIEFLVNKVAFKHSEKYAWINEVQSLFSELKSDLESHMPKEEMILFPYVKSMEGNQLQKRPVFSTISNPIHMMLSEHEHDGKILFKLREITNNYTPPEDACNSHLAMLAMLKDLDENLIQHIHLENNILFPKAEKMEKTLYPD
jgi:regulator of cell morphogenesis and NO signaling